MAPDDKTFLTGLFDAAVAAADPGKVLARHLPDKPRGRTVVVGAGKGAAQMAAALEILWDAPLEGVVVTRYGFAAPTRNVRVLAASHPVPDEAGIVAGKTLIEAVSGLTEEDLVVALVCGGGSALLPAPPDGLTLQDEQALNRALLNSGAPISAMNAVRRHVSTIKGGRLALAAHPARVVSLIVSDVPGDDPAQVASGPTVPDRTGLGAARGFVDAYQINLPDRIRDYLDSATDAPSPDDARFARNTVSIIASARISLEAAAACAERLGIRAFILSDAVEGEARDVGRVHAAIARETRLRDRPFATPAVILSGGETTVTVDVGGGRGGRNTEFLLAFAGGVEGLDVTALAADTDGIDGTESCAGAFVDGRTWERLRRVGMDPGSLLALHDSWTGLDALGDLFTPGPTGTNVNDFRAILVR
ncbi:MAG: glycerate kinase [Boseongicola sp. SB0662_bin_57]|nr:glycerate kinase [Boseongicola sp. SB0662_bin_57]